MIVTPAQAGVQTAFGGDRVPACAGMTEVFASFDQIFKS